MSDTTTPHDDFDPARRQDELVARFTSLGPDEARRQIGILPYYHQLENEITKPAQGVFVTRYFLTKWQPSLGSEASSVVLALRLLADNTGRTFASIDTIAQYAGMGVRSLKRWISDNVQAIQPCSPERLEQWRMLHTYFLRSKSSRYLLKKDPAKGAIVRRTTSLYEVAMDDPVHPSDEGTLFVLAAQRIVQQESAERAKTLTTKENLHKGQIGLKGRRKSITIETDSNPTREEPAHKGQTGPHVAGPNWPSRSLSDRFNVNVSNVRVTSKGSESGRSLFAQDRRVRELTPTQREEREALVLELGDWLHRKHGYRDTDAHKSAGVHRRAVYFAGPDLVRQAMRILDDRIEEGRAGRKEWIRDPSAAFWGVLRNLAAEAGVSLDPRGERPAERKNEALARPVEAAPSVPSADRRSVGGEVRQERLPEEDRSPEARARIYADNFFALRYRLEHDGREPSAEEIEEAYEERLEQYRSAPPTSAEPSRP